MKKAWVFIILAATLFPFILVFLLPDLIRGSDQFWYLSEMKSLMDAFRPLSNYVYPRFLAEGYDINAMPPVHNSYVIGYLYYALMLTFGIAKGFLTGNAIAYIVTAALSAYVVNKFTSSKNSAYFAYLLMILFPLGMFLCMNMLQETFIALCSAITVFLWTNFYFRKSLIWGICSLVFACLFILVYPIYIFASLFILCHTLYVFRRRALALIPLWLLLTCCAVVFEKSFMPSLGGIYRLESILTIDYYRVNAVQFYFSDTGGSLNEWLAFRFGRAMRDMILKPINFAFILLIYSTYFYSALRAIKGKTQNDIFKFLMQSAFVLPLSGMFLLHQFQIRYTLLLLPCLLPTYFDAFESLNFSKALKKTSLTALLTLFIFGCGAAIFYQVKSLSNRSDFEKKLDAIFADCKGTGNVLNLAEMDIGPYIYPARVAIFSHDHPRSKDADFSDYADKTECKYVFVQDNMLEDERFKRMKNTSVGGFEINGQRFYLYKINRGD